MNLTKFKISINVLNVEIDNAWPIIFYTILHITLYVYITNLLLIKETFSYENNTLIIVMAVTDILSVNSNSGKKRGILVICPM